MKTKNDPRHLNRIHAIKEIFAQSFHTQKTQSVLARAVLKKQIDIDALIHKGAPEWPIDKIEKIDLAILRVAVYELSYTPNTPAKVVIDEAVEIAKEFGKTSSSRFVNGVLGTILSWKQKIS